MNHKELITKQVNESLSTKEQLIFDSLLKNDITFKKKWQVYLQLKIDINNAKKETLKTVLNKQETVNKKFNLSDLLISIAFIGFVSLGIFYFSNYKKVSNNFLFAQNFEPYRNIIHPIERSDNKKTEVEIAFITYEKGEHKKAVALFDELYRTKKDSYYLFYKANSLLKIDKPRKAIPLLLTFLKTDSFLTNNANWYLALAYLKTNETYKTKKVLKKIVTKKLYNIEEAKKLLVLLNQ